VKSRIKLLSLAPVLFTLLILAAAPAKAQEVRGTITGRITDSGGAVIAGASVRIINTAQGTNAQVESNESGLFRVPYLLAGSYQMVVEAQGFKKYLRDGIVIRIGDTLETDAQLEVGSLDQSVTVNADAPVLDTTTASMGRRSTRGELPSCRWSMATPTH
jgi:hypothetical protein